MTIYDEYIEYCNTFKAKYGNDTAVLLEVGQFFEIYATTQVAHIAGTDNGEEERYEGADIKRIAELCNLVATFKNKGLPEGRGNPRMAGFPSSALYKHAQTLVQAGWTVVVVRQVTPPPNVKRAVTEVLSPSTVIDNGSCQAGQAAEGTFLVVMAWQTCARTKMPSVGVAGVDVNTGHTFVAEAASSTTDPSHAYDEAHRLVHAYAPKEVVLIGSQDEDKQAAEALQCPSPVLARWGAQHCQEYEKLAFQNHVLARAYAKHPRAKDTMLSMVELAGLDRLDLARTAFAYMLQFAYEHNEAIIDRVQLPQVLEPCLQLTLEYNTAVQLNLTGGNGERPLHSLLNRCDTAFGRRLFRERLLSPSCETSVIQARLDSVERFVQDAATRVEVHKQLRGMSDVERALRRMVVHTFHPLDWGALHASLERACAVCEQLAEGTHLQEARDLIASYASVLHLDACARYLSNDIKGNVFLPGVHPTLDAIESELQGALQQLQAYADALGAACDKTAASVCKVECNDRDGYHLTMTKRRWELASKQQEQVSGTPIASFRTAPISASSSTLRITCPAIQRLSDLIHQLQAQMASEAQARYREFVQAWLGTQGDTAQRCVAWLAEVDVACTCARNAVDFGYTRPTLLDEHEPNIERVDTCADMPSRVDTCADMPSRVDTCADMPSRVDCVGMRHPIIERLHMHHEYVPNDITLDGSGLLLYGINASGKSSTMKAVGLNVIMAQAGMYVACGSMRLRPYARIFTRISGADNIYRGMSSFTVEMTELRNILQRADRRSLVLGDELCCGTEAVSALAIVTAGIHHLSHARASFIFATHLHELTAMPAFKELANVRVGHMHIELDAATGAIVYHRTLRDGQGSAVYGLEVCRALGLPDAFLRLADATRRHIQQVPPDLVLAQGKKKSRYNKQVVMDVCKVCNAAPATETHHITYQRDFGTGQGQANAANKHRASNLVPLCEACHLREHAGELHIHGYQQTTQGMRLHVTTPNQA